MILQFLLQWTNMQGQFFFVFFCIYMETRYEMHTYSQLIFCQTIDIQLLCWSYMWLDGHSVKQMVCNKYLLYWLHSHVQCCYEFAKTNGLTIMITTMWNLTMSYHLQQQNYMPKLTMLTANSCKRKLIIVMSKDGDESCNQNQA